MAAHLSDLSVKTALYHHERGRVYRPTAVELQTNKFSCPRCRTVLTEVRIRATDSVLSCPSCRWSIHRNDIWSPAAEQEPTVRAPGEATETPENESAENSNPLADLSVEDIVPDLQPIEVRL